VPPLLTLLLLTVALVVASGYDIVARRIPNELVLCLLVAGLVATLWTGGPRSFAIAILLVAVGLVLWLPFYALGMLGAGDVKLFAASCAWFATFWQVFLAALVSAVAGGILAILWALAQRRVVPVIGALVTRVRLKVEMPIDDARAKVPYGIAMAVGVLWSFVRVQ
jgi:prepilin peptidase CpaA